MKKLLLLIAAACCMAACNKELGPEYKTPPDSVRLPIRRRTCKRTMWLPYVSP